MVKRLRRRETEDTTPVTAYFIGLLIYMPMQADTIIVSRLTYRYTAVFVIVGISYDEMYEYLYQVYQLIKSIDQFTVILAE